ncbi:MAG: hypothetical protein QXK88_03715 [Desulfurococcaceae archaeon]
MSAEPYARFSIMGKDIFLAKRSVSGTVIAVMDLRLPDRELKLITPHTRAVKSGEIHELILTSNPDAKPGSSVKGAVYLCFFEVTKGGIVAVGDILFLRKEPLCSIAGFDETHMPNHMNIICYTKEPKTGGEIGLHLGEELIISS